MSLLPQDLPAFPSGSFFVFETPEKFQETSTWPRAAPPTTNNGNQGHPPNTPPPTNLFSKQSFLL
jgi:hypothetical protein